MVGANSKSAARTEVLDMLCSDSSIVRSLHSVSVIVLCRHVPSACTWVTLATFVLHQDLDLVMLHAALLHDRSHIATLTSEIAQQSLTFMRACTRVSAVTFKSKDLLTACVPSMLSLSSISTHICPALQIATTCCWCR